MLENSPSQEVKNCQPLKSHTILFSNLDRFSLLGLLLDHPPVLPGAVGGDGESWLERWVVSCF